MGGESPAPAYFLSLECARGSGKVPPKSWLMCCCMELSPECPWLELGSSLEPLALPWGESFLTADVVDPVGFQQLCPRVT